MGNEIYLVGTINKDSITYPDGRQLSSYGGLLYSIVPLAQLTGAACKISPIVNLGKDCHEDVFRILNQYPNVNTELVTVVEEANNHCHLTYTSQEFKQEILSGGVPLIKYSALKKALHSDLFLLNFISGNDINLETLDKFRSEYSGQIYIDIHSLTLGKTNSGQRYLRQPDRWQDYCSAADYLQMNIEEFKLLSGKELTLDNQKLFFEQFGKHRLRALLVTCGNQGAYLTGQISSNTDCLRISTEPALADADTTGCGDIFGASFCAGILSSMTIESSARLAVRTASRACSFRGIESLNFSPLS